MSLARVNEESGSTDSRPSSLRTADQEICCCLRELLHQYTSTMKSIRRRTTSTSLETRDEWVSISRGPYALNQSTWCQSYDRGTQRYRTPPHHRLYQINHPRARDPSLHRQGPQNKTLIYSSKQLLNVASTPNKRVVLSISGTEATLSGTRYSLLIELWPVVQGLYVWSSW